MFLPRSAVFLYSVCTNSGLQRISPLLSKARDLQGASGSEAPKYYLVQQHLFQGSAETRPVLLLWSRSPSRTVT